MSFEWPLAKLDLINSALSQTGDNQIAVADDGSDEWITCSPAYERGIAFVCEDHPWSWLTEVRTLVASPTAPADTQFDTAYVIPPDLIHLLWVRVSDRPTVWGFLKGQIVANAQGGPPPPSPPQTPAVVTAKGIFSTNADPQHGTPTVILALQAFVMSGIYRGLHEDTKNADAMFAAGMDILQRAKTRHDQQGPKRSMFNSRLTTSRRVRRPWPPTPVPWNETGMPG